MTDLASFRSTLVKSEVVAEGTMAFHFLKPERFEFRAGQSIDVTLIDPPETDGEGNTRAFSIASAPFESDLMVATRMRDTAFKRVLGKASAGLDVKIDGPSGSLVLRRKADRPAVFLAGGIGITPFRSIIRQATQEEAAHQLWLFYSNRRPEDAPFLDLFVQCAKDNPRFHFIATMTEIEKSRRNWTGGTGFVTPSMLAQYLPAIQGPVYYLAGPPAMVAAMRHVLADAEVDEDDIRTEEFSGY
jgi:ferredoxin-NADP reductase